MRYFFITITILFSSNLIGQTIHKNSNDYFFKKPAKYYFDFDSSKSEIENFDSGYVDTFSIAKIHFKLFSNPDSSNDLEMDVLKNGNWTKNFKTTYTPHGNSHEEDINNDGFNDFQQFFKRGADVYLFNNNSKRFVDTSIGLDIEYELLDKSKNIFYEISKQDSDTEWTSDLYKFEGLKQNFLFTIECKAFGGSMNIGQIILYKCPNGNLSDTTFIRKMKIDKNFFDFDYDKFWLAILNKESQ